MLLEIGRLAIHALAAIDMDAPAEDALRIAQLPSKLQRHPRRGHANQPGFPQREVEALVADFQLCDLCAQGMDFAGDILESIERATAILADGEAPSKPRAGQAVGARAFYPDELVNEAPAISNIIEYAIGARDTLSNIRLAARIDVELSKRLDNYDVHLDLRLARHGCR